MLRVGESLNHGVGVFATQSVWTPSLEGEAAGDAGHEGGGPGDGEDDRHQAQRGGRPCHSHQGAQ